MKIILTKQSGGVLAEIDGNPKCWGWGKTTDEAVGSLLRAHREVCGVQILWDLEDSYTKLFVLSSHDFCCVA